MDAQLRVILQQLQAERGVDLDILLEAIRSAIESAARKSGNYAADVMVEMDPNTVSFTVYEVREVVEVVNDPSREIALDAARVLNPDVQVGQRLKVATEPKDFGRIASQTARQVMIQRLKDAEREKVYDAFKGREGEVVVGIVKRVGQGNIIVTVDGSDAVIPQDQQSPRENFKPGDRIRAYVLAVERAQRGPEVVLSRTSPELVRGLFIQTVPEMNDETIEIRSIAREPGSRTKIAVWSNDPNVDPVGACVGMKGARVRAVVEELNGEKIDIVRWSPNPVEFCANALNPADISEIQLDKDNKSILVMVPNDQLSLAIGKRGQNARLASRLIGLNIDIKSEADIFGAPAEEPAAAPPSPDAQSGAGKSEVTG